MSVSKLFTPRLRAAQATPIRRSEGAPIFVNPPTHAEVPVFFAPTDSGQPGYPLHMSSDCEESTTGVTRRPIATKTDKGNY